MGTKWLVVGGLWMVALSAQAQEADTTLSWLTRTALERHPAVRAAAAAAAGARERAVAAGALADPEFMLGYNATGGSAGALGRASAGLRQTLPWPGARQAGRDAALAAAAARGHARDVARVAVVRDLHAAWHARHNQARQAELLRDHQAWLARLEALARQRLAAGAASRADLLRLQMDRDELASMIRRLAIETDATEALIRRLAGLAADDSFPAPSGPIPDLSFTVPVSESHPMLAESAAMAEEAGRMARLTALETRPMIGLGVEVMGPSALGMGGETMVIPSVSVSLPIWRSANRARIAASEAEAATTAHRASEVRLNLLNEREEAMARYRDAQDRIRLYRTRLLPASIEIADLVLADYATGRASAEDVIRARRETLDLHMRLADAQTESNQAVIRLQSLYPDLP